MNKIGIILVNYNGYLDTVECIKSVLSSDYQNYEIFTIDNASTVIPQKEQLDYIKENSFYLRNAKNAGFSGANNIGIKIAIEHGCDYILLLNNDTVVLKDTLSQLMNTIIKNKNYGIVTGKIYYYYDKKLIWSAGGEYNRYTGITTQYGGTDSEENNLSRLITFATGCLMLIPVTVINKVGGLSESFFLYSEDTDYSQRVLDANFKIYYNSNAVIYHKVSASIGNMSYAQERYMARNNMYMIKKYGKLRPVTDIIFICHMFKEIIRKRSHIKPVLQGFRDYCKHRQGPIV